ncbi:FliM/FliN family flagellar motor switch protein [Profundibacterium mesophilum]|uniref:FliM/FliN family flagellar motor switch protein n=1 Tax=Profundibacterium mesophilum TaxID=1258573 RepID=UPI0013590F07|nr:FliM/FliN family flagellar motor switch protein [Profundibacterium mesophilum]
MTSDTPDGPVEEQIIHMATISYERMPMLEVLFDRFALSLSGAIKSYSGATTEVTLTDFSYGNCGAALDSLAAPTLVAMTSATGWEGRLATVIEPKLLFSLLEFMLGGRTAGEREWEPRSFTTIEKRIGSQLCDVALRELSSAFAPVTDVEFCVDHLENSPRALVLAPPASACIKVELRVEVEGRGGNLIFVIPNATFEKLRPQLIESFFGAQLGVDTGWRDQLAGSLQGTNVDLTAVLHELQVPLNDVLAWQRGQTIDLGIAGDNLATVTCSGRPMFRAAMGRRRNGSVALRVTEKLEDKEMEELNGALD